MAAPAPPPADAPAAPAPAHWPARCATWPASPRLDARPAGPEHQARQAHALQGRRHQRHALAQRHQRQHRQPVAHLVPHLGYEAVRLAHLMDALVIGRRHQAGKQDQPLAPEPCQIDGRRRLQRMAGGQAGDEGLGGDQPAGNAFGRLDGMHQRDIQAQLLQAQQLLGAVGLQHVHAHIGMGALHLRQCLRQAPVQAGADEAQPQMPARALGDVARLLRGLAPQRQQLACARVQMRAGGGQAHASAAALE